MIKTILLTQNPNGLSKTVSKWLFIVLGLFSALRGIGDLTIPSLTNWNIFLGLLLLLSGLLMLTLGFILFNPTNKFAPKVVIDEDEITIREDVFKRTKLIKWSDIKLIEFKSYALDFSFIDNKSQLFILPTTAETSMEVKKSLREVADRKLINIKGG